MREMTVEERARKIAEMGDFHSLYGVIKTEIVAAVEAATERCAKVNCVDIECPECGADPGDYCAKMYAVHEARLRAAIRAALHPEAAAEESEEVRGG